jgi:hypothetical protein
VLSKHQNLQKKEKEKEVMHNKKKKKEMLPYFLIKP